MLRYKGRQERTESLVIARVEPLRRAGAEGMTEGQPKVRTERGDDAGIEDRQ